LSESDSFTQNVAPRVRSILALRRISDLDDEGTESESALDETEVLKFPIGAVHGVGINGHLANDFAHGRKLVARLELSAFDGVGDLIHQLTKRGSIGSGIEAKGNGWRLIVHVLVH
jgi:hypothetical protein